MKSNAAVARIGVPRSQARANFRVGPGPAPLPLDRMKPSRSRTRISLDRIWRSWSKSSAATFRVFSDQVHLLGRVIGERIEFRRPIALGEHRPVAGTELFSTTGDVDWALETSSGGTRYER